MQSKFNNRIQITKIGDIISNRENIKLGVPQGSELVPLLFIIFINDLPCYLENTFSIFSAEDTTILFSKPTIDEIVKNYYVSLEKLIDWCNFNNLSIKWDKTFVMFIKKKGYYPSKIS